jgi:hypothetical protein
MPQAQSCAQVEAEFHQNARHIITSSSVSVAHAGSIELLQQISKNSGNVFAGKKWCQKYTANAMTIFIFMFQNNEIFVKSKKKIYFCSYEIGRKDTEQVKNTLSPCQTKYVSQARKTTLILVSLAVYGLFVLFWFAPQF